MKPICPYCHSSHVYETNTIYPLIDELLSPAALISLGVSLCKSFKVHPVIGVVTGTAVATVIEMTRNSDALPMLSSPEYRCGSCDHVFN